jgi:hypothetical protein
MSYPVAGSDNAHVMLNHHNGIARAGERVQLCHQLATSAACSPVVGSSTNSMSCSSCSDRNTGGSLAKNSRVARYPEDLGDILAVASDLQGVIGE